MPRPLAAALTVLALLAVGCGDDDGPDAEPAATAGDDTVAPREDDDAETSGDTVPDEDPEETTTTAADAGAEEPPGSSGGADEGMGDPFVYVADMRGADVPGGAGDAGATGRIEIRTADGRLCTDMEASGLSSDVIDAHVHEGAAGEIGDIVLPIGLPTGGAGDTATWDDVCVPVADDLARRLDTDAALFHADVHTRSHGDGAIRGQLGYATIFDLTLP